MASLQCFHGTRVELAGGGYGCTCDAGWNPDQVLFRLKECTLPDNSLLGAMVVHAFFTALFVLLVLRNLWYVRNAKMNEAKRVAIFALGYIVG